VRKRARWWLVRGLRALEEEEEEKEEEERLLPRVVVAKARRKQKPGGIEEEEAVAAATTARRDSERTPAGRSAIMAVKWRGGLGGGRGEGMSVGDLRRRSE
jgi:hypothetical protein